MKTALTDLANLQNETTAVNAINDNNAVIITAFENTLSRNGEAPNQMLASLDMNSNRILNLPTPFSNYDPLRLIDVNTVNGSGITVSPLPVGGSSGQVLTKNSATNFDTSWATPTLRIVTPEQYGYTSYGSGDAGPAINAAINANAGPVIIDFGVHTYNISTPILITKDGVWLRGQGLGSSLYYTPTTNNTSLITYHNPSVTTGIYYGRITNLQIISPDHGFVKTAINLIDVGDMEISGLVCVVWNDATSSSVFLQTNGRQTSSFHDLRIFADIPISIQPNPNSSLSADHFHFWNLYLIPAVIRPCITAGNILFTNTTFDGFQAWVGGTHGFFYDAPSSPGLGEGLSFYNVRLEEAQSPLGYSFFISTPQNTVGVLLKNCKMDEGRQGFWGRGINNLSLEEVYYPVVTPTSKVALDVDTSCKSVLVSNCRWESGCTQSLGGLTTVYAHNTPASSPIPSNALYSA